MARPQPRSRAPPVGVVSRTDAGTHREGIMCNERALRLQARSPCPHPLPSP